uniref:Uncharacterized protein n=1 Tax=Meloidogyne enterolobii TaxID=390850 RepID=A0A6V7VYD7_MELEN|nr:unnamed protein product [Meloidogyne enterolobii]
MKFGCFSYLLSLTLKMNYPIIIALFIFTIILLINAAPQYDLFSGQHIGAHGTGMGPTTYSWNFPFWRFFKS